MIMMLSDGQFEDTVIVDKDALIPAMTPQMISQPAASPSRLPGLYGYGIGVGSTRAHRVSIGHSGAFALGTGTNYVMVPAEKLGIIAISNASPVGAVEALNAQFIDLVELGEITRDWLSLYNGAFTEMMAPVGRLVGESPPANPSPPADLAAYEGVYQSPYFGKAVIEAHQDKLSLILGPAEVSYALRHWAGDTFYFSVFNENMTDGSLSSIAFERGQAGEFESFEVEYLNEHGLGQFRRSAN
jgi:CubicO group peptidase (beta-lactamase class C family)